MSSLEFCISKDEWADADATKRKALNDQANAAYWKAFEVIHNNSDWSLVEKDGFMGFGTIKKPQTWKGSEFDPFGSHPRKGKWPVAAGEIAYKRAPGVNENAGTVYPKRSTKKYPLCPNTVMDTAKEGYKSFIKQMVALGAPWADQIGLNDGIGAAEIAHAAKGPKEAAEIAAKIEAEKAKKTAEEDAIAAAVIGEYKDVEYKEQCFLLAKIFEIIQYKNLNIEPTVIKPLPYNAGEGNACVMAQGDPYAFMNKLTQYPTQQHLLEAKTHEIASLQPKIRLYKIMKNTRGEEFAQEFNFDSHATKDDLASMLTTAGKRGFGAGIKEFSFTYEGNNPFAVKKSISAKLSIFANTFDELLKDRGGYMYADLALKTGGAKAREALEKLNTQNADVKLDNLAKLDFRLKAVVGWAQPTNPVFSNPQIADAINNSFVTLNLTPTVHEFDFDDAGRVTFTCNYLAYVEDFFDQPAFNVFSERVVEKNILKRKLQYKAYNEVCNAEKMSEYKKQVAPEIKSDKNKSLRSIFTLLSKYDRLNYINLPYAHLVNFKEQGPYFNLEEATGFEIGKVSEGGRVGLAKTIVEATSDPAPEEDSKEEGFFSSAWSAIKSLVSDDSEEDARTEREKMISKITKDAETEQIVFFYLSDLIDVILKGMEDKLSSYDSIMEEAKKELKDVPAEMVAKEKEKAKRYYDNFKKFRVLLGPVEIINPANQAKSQIVNFGDIPISLRYFLDWLGDKTIKRDEATYPLPKFLNDLMNNLVRDFLNNDSCFGYSIKQKTRVNQASVTAYSDGGYLGTGLDPVAGKIGEMRVDSEKNTISRLYMDVLKADSFPILNIAGVKNDPRAGKHANEFNFLVYYAARTQPVERMNGNYHEDTANGILHYMIGKDRGIIKNIQLQKTESPGLKEVRFEQEGFDGLNQLREVYDVTIDTYANVNAFPGVYVFVDPRGFVPNMSYEVKEQGFNIEDLSDYGLGGYYMIIRSEHTFGPGKSNTRITAKWVNEIHKELDKRDKKAVKAGKAPKNTPQKCGILTQERKQAESSWFSNVMGSKLSPSKPKDTVSKPGPDTVE